MGEDSNKRISQETTSMIGKPTTQTKSFKDSSIKIEKYRIHQSLLLFKMLFKQR